MPRVAQPAKHDNIEKGKAFSDGFFALCRREFQLSIKFIFPPLQNQKMSIIIIV